LIEEQHADMETLRDDLRSLSLANAKQLVIGSMPDLGVILHVDANTTADFVNALIKFAQVSGVTGVLTLMLRTRQ
jgi:hypothetical protein